MFNSDGIKEVVSETYGPFPTVNVDRLYQDIVHLMSSGIKLSDNNVAYLTQKRKHTSCF